MQGFLPIPALEAPSDGMAFVFSAPKGRPGWTALTGGSLTGFVAGQVAFGSSTGGLTTDANLSYNAGTGALTLGKTTATHTISSTVASTSAATGALVVAGGVGIGGDVYLAGDGANQGSKLIGSPYGILVRHRGYGYSPSTYTAVQVSQAAHGVGFGVDPLSITGGQFTGDSTDVFFTRNAVIGCPNSGATDWVWALKIAGGNTSKGSPTLTIDDASVTITSGFPLQLGNAYVATPPTCTGYVTLKDSTGTTYKVMVST